MAGIQNCPHADVHCSFDPAAKLKRATSKRELSAIFAGRNGRRWRLSSGAFFAICVPEDQI
jgi:hypothetical protein